MQLTSALLDDAPMTRNLPRPLLGSRSVRRACRMSSDTPNRGPLVHASPCVACVLCGAMERRMCELNH